MALPATHIALTGANDIVDAMARALFVSTCADACENGDLPGCPTAGAGEDWMDVAPETPKEAYAAAHRLAVDICQKNGVPGLCILLRRAREADHIGEDSLTADYRADFGHYLAMQALGHGVSWFDEHARFDLKIPRCEFHVFGRAENGDWDIYHSYERGTKQ